MVCHMKSLTCFDMLTWYFPLYDSHSSHLTGAKNTHQHCGCWWPGAKWHQAICNHNDDTNLSQSHDTAQCYHQPYIMTKYGSFLSGYFPPDTPHKACADSSPVIRRSGTILAGDKELVTVACFVDISDYTKWNDVLEEDDIRSSFSINKGNVIYLCKRHIQKIILLLRIMFCNDVVNIINNNKFNLNKEMSFIRVKHIQ